MAMVNLLRVGVTIPTFVSADTDFAHPATSLTTTPGSIAVGDLLVTFLHSYIQPAPTPSGWTTQIASSDAFKSWACCTRTADAGDVGATFTWTPDSGTVGYPMHVVTLVLRGGDIVSATGSQANNGGSQVPEAPSVSPATAGLLVCGFIADRGVFSGDPTPLGVPSGMTHRAEIGGAGGGLLATTEVVPAGATGARTSTTPYNPSYNVGMAIVVHG